MQMKQKPLNQCLSAAKTSMQDEFYTQLSDIEKELRHYTQHTAARTNPTSCKRNSAIPTANFRFMALSGS
jgi:hypothetical protein